MRRKVPDAATSLCVPPAWLRRRPVSGRRDHIRSSSGILRATQAHSRHAFHLRQAPTLSRTSTSGPLRGSVDRVDASQTAAPSAWSESASDKQDFVSPIDVVRAEQEQFFERIKQPYLP